MSLNINVVRTQKTTVTEEVVAEEALLTPEQFNYFIDRLIADGVSSTERITATNFEFIHIVPKQVQGASEDGSHTIYKDMIAVQTKMKSPPPVTQ